MPGRLVLAGPTTLAWIVASVARRLAAARVACMIKRHPEPLLWLLFSAGGVHVGDAHADAGVAFRPRVSAGVADAASHEQLLAVISNPLTRVALFALCIAVTVPLGASLPLHALRRAADQAPERGDVIPRLLWRRGGGHADRGVSARDGAVTNADC